jgi:hypothetical protein
MLRYVLDEIVSEPDFVAARAAEARDIANWTAPQPRHLMLSMFASERLAFLAIYKQGTPLHQLSSVAEKDFIDLSYESFSAWLRGARQEHLMALDAEASLRKFLGLPDKINAGSAAPISLNSPRTPPGVLYFDGDRFGIPALIMVSLGVDLTARDLANSNAWRRFSCAGSKRLQFGDAAANGAISDVTCHPHALFATDAWLAFAIRRSDGSAWGKFCQQAKAFADHADIVSLLQSMPESSRGLYIMLPRACERHE